MSNKNIVVLSMEDYAELLLAKAELRAAKASGMGDSSSYDEGLEIEGFFEAQERIREALAAPGCTQQELEAAFTGTASADEDGEDGEDDFEEDED